MQLTAESWNGGVTAYVQHKQQPLFDQLPLLSCPSIICLLILRANKTRNSPSLVMFHLYGLCFGGCNFAKRNPLEVARDILHFANSSCNFQWFQKTCCNLTLQLAIVAKVETCSTASVTRCNFLCNLCCIWLSTTRGRGATP